MYAYFSRHTERKKSMRKMKRMMALLLAVLMLPVFAYAEETAAEEACQIEHVISDTTMEKIKQHMLEKLGE